jgi:TonB family protein
MKNISTRRVVIAQTCPRSVFTSALAAIIILGGCQKTERAPTTEERLKSVAEKQETTPDFYVPRKTVDYMADLKNIRETAPKADAPPAKEETKDSAREAAKAARLAAAANAAAAVETPKAVVPTAATPAPPPVTAPSFAPVTTAAPTPAAPAARPAADAAPANATPPPTTVASAAPTARPASPPSSTASPIVSVVAREQPEFPREAARQGVESGTVRARLTINAAGDVTNVAIVQAKPGRVFDRAVTSSLSRWKFNPGTEGRNYETEIVFQR